MNPLTTSMAAFAITTIYMMWSKYDQIMARRQKHLRERVAFMLWEMANRS